jgi:hypothetical protein
LTQYDTDAQDGIAVMFFTLIGSVAAYVGAHGSRLWKWRATRSNGDEA